MNGRIYLTFFILILINVTYQGKNSGVGQEADDEQDNNSVVEENHDMSIEVEEDDEVNSQSGFGGSVIESNPSSHTKSMSSKSLISNLDNLVFNEDPLVTGNFGEDNLSTICTGSVSQMRFSGLEKKSLKNFTTKTMSFKSFQQPMSTSDFRDEIEIYSAQNKIYYTFIKFPSYRFDYFKNELLTLYKLKDILEGQKHLFKESNSLGAPFYNTCFYKDDNLFIVTEENEHLESLTDPDMLEAIGRMSQEKLKGFYNNLAVLVQTLHNMGISHGSLVLDNIVTNYDMSQFKLKNFQLSALNSEKLEGDFYSFIDRAFFMCAADTSINNLDNLYYNDNINLLFIFVSLDSSAFNKDEYDFFLNSNPTGVNLTNMYVNHKVAIMAINPLSLPNSMAQLLKGLRKEKSRKFEKDEVCFFSFCGPAEHKDTNRKGSKISRGFGFGELHIKLYGLVRLNAQILTSALITTDLNNIPVRYFSTWLEGPKVNQLQSKQDGDNFFSFITNLFTSSKDKNKTRESSILI